MPRRDPILNLQEQINELKAEIARLKTTQRNIDYLALRDGVAAPTAVVGQAIQYVDSSGGDLKVVFGDGVIKTIVTDT